MRIHLLIASFTLLLLFAQSCWAEPESENISEQERAILNHLKHSVDSLPVPIDEKSYIGLFSSKLGPANLELSLLRGLELTWDDSDFSLKVGGRIYLS